jgi:hypothetical protein
MEQNPSIVCGLFRQCFNFLFRVPGHGPRGPVFYPLRYQIFWEIVGLEWVSLSLMSTIEELLGRKRSGSSLESRDYGCGNPLCWLRDTLYPQKLALTSPTSGGRSVGMVCSRTKVTEFFHVLLTQTFCCVLYPQVWPGSFTDSIRNMFYLYSHHN